MWLFLGMSQQCKERALIEATIFQVTMHYLLNPLNTTELLPTETVLYNTGSLNSEHTTKFFFLSSKTLKKQFTTFEKQGYERYGPHSIVLVKHNFMFLTWSLLGWFMENQHQYLHLRLTNHRELVKCATSSVVTITVQHLHYVHFNLQIPHQYVTIF